MNLSKNIKTTKNLLEGIAVEDGELKKYINGELEVKGVDSIEGLTSNMKYEVIKNAAYKRVKDQQLAKNSQNWAKVEEGKSLVENIVKAAGILGMKLNESAVIQVDMAMELMNVIDSSKLPKFITIGETAYVYQGSSSPDLQKLLTADKGVVGKIIYTQGEGEIDSSNPKEIELQIVKTIANRKTLLSVGNIQTR